jgi:signal transduction histidine kinase
LSLSIQDDGQGFDVRQTKGLGLLGMEERVASLGGKCEIHSAPGNGTIVAIELPFSKIEGSPDARGNEKDSNSIGG